MIGRTNCGAGGGGKITLTLYGGKGEVITYTGAETGAVTLDDSGVGFAMVKKGVYQFSAGLSGTPVDSSRRISAGSSVIARISPSGETVSPKPYTAWIKGIPAAFAASWSLMVSPMYTAFRYPFRSITRRMFSPLDRPVRSHSS